jgi:hypothetical protein
VLAAPHASHLLERLLRDLDADLLVLEEVAERVTQLGGVVEQARPCVRLASHTFQNPLRDYGWLPGRQTHVRDAVSGLDLKINDRPVDDTYGKIVMAELVQPCEFPALRVNVGSPCSSPGFGLPRGK